MGVYTHIVGTKTLCNVGYIYIYIFITLKFSVTADEVTSAHCKHLVHKPLINVSFTFN